MSFCPNATYNKHIQQYSLQYFSIQKELDQSVIKSGNDSFIAISPHISFSKLIIRNGLFCRVEKRRNGVESDNDLKGLSNLRDENLESVTSYIADTLRIWMTQMS